MYVKKKKGPYSMLWVLLHHAYCTSVLERGPPEEGTVVDMETVLALAVLVLAVLVLWIMAPLLPAVDTVAMVVGSIADFEKQL